MKNKSNERLAGVLKILKDNHLWVFSFFSRAYSILFGIFFVVSNLWTLNNFFFRKNQRSFGTGKGLMISLGNNILGPKMQNNYMMRLIF